MLFPEETVQFQVPVFECDFTEDEIHELLTHFEPGHSVSSNSGSDSNRTVYSVEERQLKRKLSNRESARRSRWRKKRHLENLNSDLNQLRVENQVLKNRLHLASRQCCFVQTETDRLQTESLLLQQKLAGLHQILAAMRLQY